MDLRRLTLHQLRVFRAVAHRGSFTRAAEELHLTQSAISAQVRVLTEVLGVPLFEQLGKKIHLTSGGRALLDRAERMESLVGEIDQVFTALLEEGAGSVRVGASTSIGTYFLPALIADFSSCHPKVDVSLDIENTAHIQDRLLQNDFDIAFVGGPVTAPELTAVPFLKDKIFFACAPTHPLSSSRSTQPEQLVGYKLIVRESGSATRASMEQCLGTIRLRFPHVVQLGSVEAIKQTVMAGLGISYFSELTVRHELTSGRLVRLNVPGVSVLRTFFVARHRQKREMPALRTFQGFLARDHEPEGFPAMAG